MFWSYIVVSLTIATAFLIFVGLVVGIPMSFFIPVIAILDALGLWSYRRRMRRFRDRR
jgi:hypothetical protein